KLAFALVLGLSMMFHNASFAQEATAAADTVTEASSTSVETDSALTAASVEEAETVTAAPVATTTTNVSAAAEAPDPGIPAQVYVNFFFYVLLFLLVCFIVGIIGKIMDIYGITK